MIHKIMYIAPEPGRGLVATFLCGKEIRIYRRINKRGWKHVTCKSCLKLKDEK